MQIRKAKKTLKKKIVVLKKKLSKCGGAACKVRIQKKIARIQEKCDGWGLFVRWNLKWKVRKTEAKVKEKEGFFFFVSNPHQKENRAQACSPLLSSSSSLAHQILPLQVQELQGSLCSQDQGPSFQVPEDQESLRRMGSVPQVQLALVVSHGDHQDAQVLLLQVHQEGLQQTLQEERAVREKVPSGFEGQVRLFHDQA